MFYWERGRPRPQRRSRKQFAWLICGRGRPALPGWDRLVSLRGATEGRPSNKLLDSFDLWLSDLVF